MQRQEETPGTHGCWLPAQAWDHHEACCSSRDCRKGSALAAGYDLSSAHAAVVPAHGKQLIKTDLAISTPLDCYGRIAPRSGLALKRHIDVGAGVVDADYRGNVGVVLFNFGETDLEVVAGDRIAQLILERVHLPSIQEVDDLPVSSRGTDGFGSTGVGAVTQPESGAAVVTQSEACDEVPSSAVEPESNLCPAAQLLLFVHELQALGVNWDTVTLKASDHLLPDTSEACSGRASRMDAQTRQQLKALALTEDQRLFACMQAFHHNYDVEDLASTLRLIIGTEASSNR